MTYHKWSMMSYIYIYDITNGSSEFSSTCTVLQLYYSFTWMNTRCTRYLCSGLSILSSTPVQVPCTVPHTLLSISTPQIIHVYMWYQYPTPVWHILESSRGRAKGIVQGTCTVNGEFPTSQRLQIARQTSTETRAFIYPCKRGPEAHGDSNCVTFT